MSFPMNTTFGGNGSGIQPQNDPVSILLAGPVGRIQPWMNLVMSDGRFRMVSLATDANDLRSKLNPNPEVLLLDASILDSERSLIDLVTRLSCSAYVVTPVNGGADLPNRLGQIESVKGAYFADINLPDVIGRIYSDAMALRASKSGTIDTVWNHQGGVAGGPTGLRIISVWNQMGGVGKTTVATNMAYEAARRGFPTLLIGLGAPDDLPLVCGIRPEPNITQWWNNPTPEGIKLAIQKLDTLDVLPGFPDVLSEAQAINTPREAPNSIPNLITKAAHYAGYAVIVIDAPPTSLAASAISVSNTLALVARPSLEGIMRTVEAYRMVVEKMGGEHRIPTNRVFVVLNRMGGRLSADEWHRAATQTAGKSFPPIIAQIPDLPAVGNAQDNRRMPILTVDEFTRSIRPLMDTLLQQPGQAFPAGTQPGKHSFVLGPLKVKL